MKKRLARFMVLVSCGCMLFTTANTASANKKVENINKVFAESGEVANENRATEAVQSTDNLVSFEGLFGGIDYVNTVEAKADSVGVEFADASEYGYNNLGIAEVDSYLNVREAPSTDSAVVGVMADKTACEIEEQLDGWAKVSSGEVSGYVCTDYIVTGVQAKCEADEISKNKVTVNADVLIVREKDSVDSEEISRACEGTTLSIVVPEEDNSENVSETDDTVAGDENNESVVETQYESVENESVSNDDSTNNLELNENSSENSSAVDNSTIDENEVTDSLGNAGWIEVTLEDNVRGYVSAEYVSEVTQLQTASPVVVPDNNAGITLNSDGSYTDSSQNQGAYTELSGDYSGGSGSDVANFALQYVGCPYVWGGTSLSGGSDCSGFVMSVYANFGVSLPHSAAAQSGYGVSVSASEAVPGDLFFYGSGGVSHVGIYIGNGQIVHSSTPETGVRVSSAFYESPVCVKRIM